jgi:hypothetical protein
MRFMDIDEEIGQGQDAKMQIYMMKQGAGIV